MDGINFDASIAGGDEINLFCNGTLAMAFCWNVAQEKNNAENLSFDVLPMAFPAEDGKPQLCGGIWGFGVFDNGDEAKVEASKTFIDFMANDETQVVESVKASSYWPVKDLGNIYEGDDLMTEYSTFIQYMGDYYQVVGGWVFSVREGCFFEKRRRQRVKQKPYVKGAGKKRDHCGIRIYASKLNFLLWICHLSHGSVRDYQFL